MTDEYDRDDPSVATGIRPAGYFGSNSDGAVRMERWLDETCPGCLNGRTVDGQAGIGCDLPAIAYDCPDDLIQPWQPDEHAAMGLRCHARRERATRSDAGKTRQVPGQEALL